MGDLRPELESPLGATPASDDNEPEGGSEAAEYVQELIRRMGGDPDSVPVQPVVSSEPEEVSVSQPDSAEGVGTSFSMPLEHDEAEKETNVQKVVTKSRMVDSRDALMKFREAAKLTAEDAFQKFSCKRLIERAYVWLFLTCFFLINSLMARYMGVSPNGASGSILHVSVALSVVAAIRFVWLTLRVSRGLAMDS